MRHICMFGTNYHGNCFIQQIYLTDKIHGSTEFIAAKRSVYFLKNSVYVKKNHINQRK